LNWGYGGESLFRVASQRGIQSAAALYREAD
jgi:hypothetical protein